MNRIAHGYRAGDTTIGLHHPDAVVHEHRHHVSLRDVPDALMNRARGSRAVPGSPKALSLCGRPPPVVLPQHSRETSLWHRRWLGHCANRAFPWPTGLEVPDPAEGYQVCSACMSEIAMFRLATASDMARGPGLVLDMSSQ
jgi:hypothetical protein